MMQWKQYIWAILTMMALVRCETIVTLDLPENSTKLVVEGSIENGSAPVVILSRSFPLFGNVNFNDLEQVLIRGAKVKVASSTRAVELMEYTVEALVNLSPEDYALIEPTLEQFLGFDVSQGILDTLQQFIPAISFYSVAPSDFDFVGELETNYDLTINLKNDSIFGTQTYSASTYIPGLVPIDSIWVTDHPNDEIDTLYELRARFQDPDTLGNFYRIFNRFNGGIYLTSTTSVFDDAFINGESIPFTVFRGRTEREKLGPRDADLDGYWQANDVIQVKFCNITSEHYRFWRTVEREKGNAGSPFGSFTILDSNIKGENAIGIWGGYAVSTINFVIPENP